MLSQSCPSARTELLLRAQMLFKGKIYHRGGYGLRITQTAVVGPMLPFQGRDGEEFGLVTEPHAAGWRQKPECIFLGQRKRGEHLPWPHCSCLLDWFLEISKDYFIQLWKTVVYKIELGTVVLLLLIFIFVSLIPRVSDLKPFWERKGEADQK